MSRRGEISAFTRLFDILEYQQNKFPQKAAINYFRNNKWVGYSTQDLINKVNLLSCWLIENEYSEGDKIAIIPKLGLPEWIIIDFACQQVGIVLVPIHPISSNDELKIILEETEAKACIVADEGLYHKYKSVIDNLTFRIDFYHLDESSPNYFIGLELMKSRPEVEAEVKERKDSISEDALVVILYTSGTTGRPKGVMLSHRNIVSNILFTLAVFPLESGERVLSFLPFSHIFERSACYAYLATGSMIYFSGSNESIISDFQSVRPSFCTTVPRILEKMYAFVEEKKQSSGWLKKRIIKWSLSSAMNSKNVEKGKSSFRLKRELARFLVVKRWRKLLGGKINGMVVGAASLRPELALLVEAAGIKVREGYGMTETSPIISLNRFDPGMNRFGTVGIPIPGVHLKIDSEGDTEGEILVKGPNVTSGYYRQPELTAKAFTEDGWLRTGDVGHMVDGKFLKITDRKKDIFKTSAGKYIAPMPLENLLLNSSFIEQCMVIGFNRPFVAALIVPNFRKIEWWCEQHSIHWTSPQFMVHNIKVREKIESEIDKINAELPNFKRIKGFILDHEEWTPEEGYLTHSLKPRRRPLLNKFTKEIEKLYAN